MGHTHTSAWAGGGYTCTRTPPPPPPAPVVFGGKSTKRRDTRRAAAATAAGREVWAEVTGATRCRIIPSVTSPSSRAQMAWLFSFWRELLWREGGSVGAVWGRGVAARVSGESGWVCVCRRRSSSCSSPVYINICIYKYIDI